MIPTYQDAVEHLSDYLGSDPGEQALRDCKKCVQEAYRDLANAHTWTYLYTPAQLTLNGSFSIASSAVTYRHSDGPYPRVLSLAGAMWPSWAADGVIVIGIDSYRVDRRIDDQTLTLEEVSNPGSDILDLSSFILYRDTYLLPVDFIAQDTTFIPGNFGDLQYVHHREWLRLVERSTATVGRPTAYSINGSTKYPGRMLLRVAPCPDVDQQIHFAYKRRPRPLITHLASSGLVTLQAPLTAIAIGGASFSPAHLGAVIRFGLDQKNPPTSESGLSPAAHESYIADVVDPTHAILASPAPDSLTAVAYAISDPLDIEPGAMLTAFTRLSERKLSIIRIMKDRQFPIEEYLRALDSAKCADSRSFSGRSARENNIDGRYLNLWRNP